MIPIDNRIHAALNCGSKSCPPVGIFRSITLEEDLEISMKNFVKTNFKVKNNYIFTSEIFKMFRQDFIGKESDDNELIKFLSKQLDPVEKEMLKGCNKVSYTS